MITWADVIPLKTGNIIVRIPTVIEQPGQLTIVIRPAGYDLYVEKERIAAIRDVSPDMLGAFAVSELIGILEWPERSPPPQMMNRYARVVDKRAAKTTQKPAS